MPDLAEPANLLALRETYKRDKAAVLQVLADSGSAVRGLKQTLKQLAILADGLLIIDLVREVPEAVKPKKISIGGQTRFEVVEGQGHADKDESAAA